MTPWRHATLWAMLALFAAARPLQVFTGRVPPLVVVVLHVVPPLVFALIHGAMRYGNRGILRLMGICLTVGSVAELLGTRTGFPFGPYFFTDAMGPKVLDVPILLGLAYLGMGYLSWVVACLLAGPAKERHVAIVPMIAALVMTAWDFSMDPIWSTVLRCWVWRGGGPYFGVPLSNFGGWFLTALVYYLFFALYLRLRPPNPPMPSAYWRLAVLYYAVSAAGNLLFLLPHAGPVIATDPAGVPWRVSDIAAASALASIFTMGAFALVAWARISDQKL